MPGALIHIFIGLIASLVIYYKFNLEFALGIFIGNLLPDFVKVIVTSLKIGSLNIYKIVESASYTSIHNISHSLGVILVIVLFFISLVWFLYHFHKIKRKKFIEYDEFLIFVFVGMLIHLLLDLFIHGFGVWV